MARVLLIVGVVLLIAGVFAFVQGPAENPWSALGWGIPFVLGAAIVALGWRRAATRALRLVSAALLLPHVLGTGFFIAVMAVRLA